MVNPVEKFGDVHIRHPIFARLDVFLRCSNRLVLAPAASERVAVLAKSRVEDSLEPPQQHLLNPSVQDCRDTQ